MQYKKRDNNTRSELAQMDFQLYQDKLNCLVTKEKMKENFYTNRRNEIEMAWLEEDMLDPDKNYVWHASMPLPFWQCQQIFKSAKKMPRSATIALVFPDYTLNEDESSLFDVIFEYGKAKGLEVIADRLYSGAESGDPRAVKMYLELMEHIGGELTEEDQLRRLMTVSFNIG